MKVVKKKVQKKRINIFLVLIMLVSLMNIPQPLSAQENTKGQPDVRVNFALNKTATAYKAPIDYWGPDKLVDGVINRDANKPEQSRWSSEAGAPGWIKVDLGEEKTFDEFKLAWEQKVTKDYHIQVSNDDNTYTTVFTAESKADGHVLDDNVKLENAVSGRYVKLVIDSLIQGAYPSISLYEFQVIGTVSYDNMALTATATANGHEDNAANLAPDKANDGSLDTRWASTYGINQKWLALDLGAPKKIKSVVLEWERQNATNYSIEVSEDGTNWNKVKEFSKAPKDFTDIINLDEEVTAQYIRVVIDDFIPKAPDRNGKEVSWETVSLYEFEVYDKTISVPEEPKLTAQDVANAIELPEVGADDTSIPMPTVPEGFEVKFLGADYEQILARDLTITRPLTTRTVVVNFEVTETETGEKGTSPAINVVIGGIHDADASQNEKPKVIPELQEWFGHTGEFTTTDASKIVVNPSASKFMETAKIFAEDYKDVTGKDINVVEGTNPSPSDFYFTVSEEKLDKETYVMEVGDYVTVKATEATGAHWATRSILQILKQTEGTIAKGIAKDYPKYEIRGFMLDVGRKAIPLDFLEELVKTFSWYKMNDFQVHLNDNTFALDYAGFRIESNKPNLHSTDLFYTKDEFRDFINDSKELGVNIVPEFDSPGHSAAFTRARPDIARGDEIEYLDVENPETIKFIKSVYDEYLEEENPVFPESTVVHVGTDEYKRGNKEAFRKYQDDLLRYVRDEKKRTPRVWGSQTENSGTTPITVDGIQMNLWYVGYANPKQMYELGYDLINTNDGDLYIVPGAGYYYDYLNQNHIYGTWQPNKIGNFTIPVGSEQMLGATFPLWNDKTGPQNDNGTTEVEIFDRIFAITPTFGAKLWGDIKDYTVSELNELTSVTKYAPNSNPTHEVKSKTEKVLDYKFDNDRGIDNSGNEYNLTNQSNVSYDAGHENKALTLKGGTSYVETPVSDLGINSTLDFWVKKDPTDSNEEQILFESEIGSIKAVQKETGKLGFSRDFRDHSFNYTLPDNEWVHITIQTRMYKTTLFVNGVKVDELSINGTGGKWASLVMPLERIGSKTNAFKGQIDNVTVSDAIVSFDKTLIPQSKMTATATSEQSGEGADKAIDGNESTMWHTAWSGADVLPQSITLKFDQEYKINKFTYLPRSNAGNGTITEYKLSVSTDGKNFTDIATGNWVRDNSLKEVAFESVDAKYIRLTAIQGVGGFASAAELNVHKVVSEELDKTALLETIQFAEGLDTNIYTDESVAALEAAIASAKDVLTTATTQAEIDAEVTKLQDVINALEKKVVNKDALQNAIDKAKEQKEADYTPITWKEFADALKVAEETLAQADATQAQVDEAKLALEEAQAALVKKAYTYDLEVAVEVAKEVTEKDLENVVPAVVKEFKAALAEAEEILANPNATQAEVDASFDRLANALQHLSFIKGDKTRLAALIERINGLDSEKYITATWNKLQEVLVKANEVMANENALVEEVSATYNELLRAFLNLQLRPSKDALEELINKAEKLEADKYTEKTWGALEKALKEANKVMANKDATQEEVDHAVIALSNGLDGLVAKGDTDTPDTDKPDTDNPGNDSNSGTGNTPDDDSKSGTNNTQKPSDNPYTGDNGIGTSVLFALAGSVLLFGLIGMRKFRKK